ncbi:MAG: hypothetical protein EPO60_03820, partial [Rugosibacter sp.]
MLQRTMTHEEIIRRAHHLGKIAETGLVVADANGGYGTEFKEAMHEAGFHRILRPRRYGGYGLGHRTMLEAVRT